jgi:hypothetical protein
VSPLEPTSTMKTQEKSTEKTPGAKTLQGRATAAQTGYAAVHEHAQVIVGAGADASKTRR